MRTAERIATGVGKAEIIQRNSGSVHVPRTPDDPSTTVPTCHANA